MSVIDIPITKNPRLSFDRIFDEWEELYENRSYMLARMTIEEWTERSPEMVEGWFLRGLSQLAARDITQAEISFQEAQRLLDAGKRPTRHEIYNSLPTLVPELLRRIDNHTLTSAPREWRAWLRDPSLLDEGSGILHDAMNRPLGRHAPLLVEDPKRPMGALPRLAPPTSIDVPFIPVTVDTMESLLGRDRDIRIELGKIRIIDETLHIIPPEERAARQAAYAESDAERRPFVPEPGASRAPVSPGKVAVVSTATAAAAASAAAARQASAAPTREQQRPAPAKPTAPARPAAKPQQSKAAAEKPEGFQFTPKKEISAATSLVDQDKPAAEDPWVTWERQVQDLLAHGRNRDAMTMVDEALARYPDSSKLLEMRADMLHRLGDYKAALPAYVETYRKAVTAGATDRAERAYRQATELGKENADLLLDMASIAASAGAMAVAAATAKSAIDIYRRRNDRPRLMAALRQVTKWLPNDNAVVNELKRLEAEADHFEENFGGVVTKAKERYDSNRSAQSPPAPVAMQPGTADPDDGWARTRPPRGAATDSRPQAQPRQPNNTHNPYDPIQSPGNQPWKPRQQEEETPKGPQGIGLAFLIASGFVFLITLAMQSFFPGLLGFIIAINASKNGKISEHDSGWITVATVIFGLCAGLGLLLSVS